MPDADVACAAIDVFNLGAFFDAQGGENGTPTQDIAEILDNQGDLSKTEIFNQQLQYSQEYMYNGSDLDTDFLPKIGEVIDNGAVDISIDNISITFAPNEFPVINIDGHNHSAGNTHEPATTGKFDGFDLGLTALIGNLVGGKGVPDVLTNSNTDADYQSLEIAATATLVEKLGNSGEHFTGCYLDPRITVSATFTGTPVIVVPAGFRISDPISLENANDDQRSSSVTIFDGMDRTFAA